MKVVIVPCLSDNYAYVIADDAGTAAAVDPVEPEKVIKALEENGIKLDKVTHLLTTHKHVDHAGGNEDFKKQLPHVAVVGGKSEPIPAMTVPVADGDSFEIGKLTVRVLETPCHTRGHVLYYVTDKESKQGALFSGDTLFTAGCGRFFEGTADEMYNALCKKIASLPDETQVYNGHEYTVGNLKFAEHVEPENKAVKEKLEWAERQRAQNLPTIPSTVLEEKSFNPFMRVGEAGVQQFAGLTDPVAVMKHIRAAKDVYKPPAPAAATKL